MLSANFFSLTIKLQSLFSGTDNFLNFTRSDYYYYYCYYCSYLYYYYYLLLSLLFFITIIVIIVIVLLIQLFALADLIPILPIKRVITNDRRFISLSSIFYVCKNLYLAIILHSFSPV